MKTLILLLFIFNVTYLFGINIAIPSWPSHLNAPSELMDSISFNVARYIHGPLFVVNSKKNFSSHIFKKWTKDHLGKEYCFELNDSLYFHNNKEITSDDVLFSIEKCSKKMSCSLSHILRDLEVKKISKKHFCLRLKKPNSMFLFALSDKKLSVIPKQDNGGIVGAGPYRFFKKEGNKIFLKKFELYSGKKTLNESIVFHVYESNDKFLNDIEKINFQEINQMVSALSKNDMKKIEKIFPKKVQYPFFNTDIVYMNNEKKIFKDINVRKFLYCVFKKDDIYEIISEKLSIKATGLFPTGMKEHLKSYPLCKKGDMEKYYLNFKDTHNKTIEFITVYDNEKKELLQNKINEILKKFDKIKIKVLSCNKQSFYRKVRERDYEIVFITWIAEQIHPFFYIEPFHSENKHNHGNINDPKIDQLISSYTEQGKNRLKDFDLYLMKNAYLIPVSYNVGVYYYKNNLSNIDFSFLGPDSFDLSNVTEKESK